MFHAPRCALYGSSPLLFCCMLIIPLSHGLTRAAYLIFLQQQANSLLFLFSLTISDVLCVNKGKNWNRVMTHRYNVFSDSILKGQKLKCLIHKDCDQTTAEPHGSCYSAQLFIEYPV